MDINNSKPGRIPNSASNPKLPVDITRSNRQGLQKAQRQIESSRETRAQEQADRIDLSANARAMSHTSAADDARAARVAELKTEFEQGRFNSPERIAKTAARMLGAE